MKTMAKKSKSTKQNIKKVTNEALRQDDVLLKEMQLILFLNKKLQIQYTICALCDAVLRAVGQEVSEMGVKKCPNENMMTEMTTIKVAIIMASHLVNIG